MTVITGEKNIRFVQMLAQHGAMKLELMGMRHSSGRSIVAAVKKQYGLKGNKQSVVEQFGRMIETMKLARMLEAQQPSEGN